MSSLADLGVRIGTVRAGPTSSVIDVPGVGLGHATIVYDDPPPPFGRGVARTGVTVVDLGGDIRARPVVAGVSVLNGAGELTARSQVDEWGLLETPIFLTSTMQVGRVYDAACAAAHGRVAAHRRRRRRHPDGRRVRRLVAQRSPAHYVRAAAVRGGATTGARATTPSASAGRIHSAVPMPTSCASRPISGGPMRNPP